MSATARPARARHAASFPAWIRRSVAFALAATVTATVAVVAAGGPANAAPATAVGLAAASSSPAASVPGVAAAAPMAAGAGRLSDAELASRYAGAAALYEQQDHAGAERAFRALIEAAGPHPSLLLGMGNAAYRQGEWIRAVYAYEWGSRLDPADGALEQNLKLARGHLVTDTFASDESESARRAQALLGRIPGRWTLLFGLVPWTLGFLLLALRQAGRAQGWTWLGVALILLALPAWAHAGWQWQRHSGRVEGILQAPEIAVRSGPGSAYQELFDLHAGTVIRLVESRPDWSRVALPQGAEGWVRTQDLALFGALSTLAVE